MRPLVFFLLTVLAFTLAFTTVDESMALGIHGTTPSGVATTGDEAPCCKSCVCQASVVAECQCMDVKAYCDKSCRSCRCTRSIPPKCRCADVHRDNCYPPACRS
uniref:Bowman-Birk type proteinase inhibitor n=1 Tax=Anthurium amnicola TaxID=1678845 RepID=A0A1D1Z809_9ARAE